IKVGEVVDGIETVYIIDNSDPFSRVREESDNNGAVDIRYAHGRGTAPLLLVQNNQVSYYHGDQLDSTRLLTDSNGTITDRYIYDAFGRVLTRVGSTNNKYLFTGESFNSRTALNYHRARYLDINSGRFISRDPFDGFLTLPISRHSYLYANNNPVIFRDPSGLLSATELIVGFTIVGGILGASLGIGEGISIGISQARERALEGGIRFFVTAAFYSVINGVERAVVRGFQGAVLGLAAGVVAAGVNALIASLSTAGTTSTVTSGTTQAFTRSEIVAQINGLETAISAAAAEGTPLVVFGVEIPTALTTVAEATAFVIEGLGGVGAGAEAAAAAALRSAGFRLVGQTAAEFITDKLIKAGIGALLVGSGIDTFA
ncbi:MAG: RHS repeat-associated core domain-containing protein, partial [Cyanobacteria bacterium P01_H01_bin.15]